MLIINLRSSSASSYVSCPHKYFMEYVLNLKTKGNCSAAYGTAYHKVMELLNKKRLANLTNLKEVIEGDEGNKFQVEDLSPSYAIDWSFEYYKGKYPDFPWTKTVKRDLTEWVDYTLGSHYNPEKLNIHACEHFFEYEIKEPWAYYEYRIGKDELKGYLKIRGTLDLLIRHNDEYLEYLDYKTGRSMYNWTLGKEKTVDDLRHDPQLLLYYYSLKREFPQYPHLGMTLFYTKGTGAFPLQFGDEEYLRAEKMIKDMFLKIKMDAKASWIYYDRQCSYCQFNKLIDEETGKTLCKKYHDELVKVGLDKVTQKHVDIKKLGNYEGGGTTRTSEVKIEDK